MKKARNGFVKNLRYICLMGVIAFGFITIVATGAFERQLESFSQGSSGYYYNPPTLVDDHIYIGTSHKLHRAPANDNYFFKLDSNLNKVWDYALGNKEVRGSATLDSVGNIYFVVEKDRLYSDTSNSTVFLYSLDFNGTFRWAKEIVSSPNVFHSGMYNLAIATDDTIYVGGGTKFYALDTDNNEIWTFTDPSIGDIVNAPIIDADGNIYFSSFGAFVSLTSTGNKRWTFSTSGLVEHLSSPAFSTDYTKLYVGAGDTVYCLETDTGNKVWEYTPAGITGMFRATPAVDDENNVYIGTKDSENSVFYAIKADGSGILWQNKIGGDLYSSPALGDDNTVYVGSEFISPGIRFIRLHALDMTNGATKWSAYLSSGDVVWSSPAIADDGTLYIGTMATAELTTGAVYAFRTDSTGLLPNAGSPRFHEGNASTGRRE